jgi:hypothetical protein
MSEQRLCPFRKSIRTEIFNKYNEALSGPAYSLDDIFAPCLQDKCAMWRSPAQMTIAGAICFPGGACGLAGRP